MGSTATSVRLEQAGFFQITTREHSDLRWFHRCALWKKPLSPVQRTAVTLCSKPRILAACSPAVQHEL